MSPEKKAFSAEIDKMLNIMTHSLYTNKEIFIRELISNASDACDKLRYLSQINSSLLNGDTNFRITIEIDKSQKNISIRDNGVGMNKDDLIENLGTIAKSGTSEFAHNISDDHKKSSFIGQFGVGFYSAFMVAEHISVTSKKAGETKGYIWYSDGLGEYTISETDKELPRGTEVVIHLKEQEDSFLNSSKIQHIVKTYSDHISVPIYLVDDNKESKINSSSALWSRSKSEISQEQYKEFYKNLSYNFDEPWLIIHNKNEGAIEFTNLLFIPSTKNFDLFNQDRKKNIKLYIKRVFISDANIDIIPNYLRFVKGVIDAEDLPLNISREILQQNIILEKIKSLITQRVINELNKKKREQLEEYLKFWENFGPILKEGLCETNVDQEKILEICLFKSSIQNKLITLDEYISNVKSGQKTIYYLSGNNIDKLLISPQIEGFLNNGIDVLLFVDPVDSFWVGNCTKYREFEIKSVTRSNIDLSQYANTNELTKNDQINEQEKFHQLVEYFKNVLGSLVKDVKISKKLTESIACLTVEDNSMDIHTEKLLVEQNRFSSYLPKTLEINSKHPIIQKLNNNLLSNKSNEVIANNELALLIFDQACITDGQPLQSNIEFSKRINKVLDKALKLE